MTSAVNNAGFLASEGRSKANLQFIAKLNQWTIGFNFVC
ncbi:hypothetical protein LLB_2107 [Legionella longbeachae D-4968]|nr:hypothetical protein LLB_2107 [Legionella longbeachae D-4968]